MGRRLAPRRHQAISQVRACCFTATQLWPSRSGYSSPARARAIVLAAKGLWKPSAALRRSNGYLMRRNKMKLRGALLAAGVLALPLAASAQPITGLYIGAGAGVNIMQDETVKITPGASQRRHTRTADEQWAPRACRASAGGLAMASAPRSRATTATTALRAPARRYGSSAGGNEQKYGPMVNVLYDFNGSGRCFVPYIGAGIGYQWATENVRHAGRAPAGHARPRGPSRTRRSSAPLSRSPGAWPRLHRRVSLHGHFRRSHTMARGRSSVHPSPLSYNCNSRS